MSRPGCSDVCEILHDRLKDLGFNIDPDDEDHTDVIEALNKTVLIRDEDYCPQCETVCSNVSAMLEAAGFEIDGEHDAILEALGKAEFVRTDQEHRRAREIAEKTLALIARDPDFRIVRHFMEYVCAALDITGKELIDASIAVAKRPKGG